MNNFTFEPYKLKEFEHGMRLPEIKISEKERHELALPERASNTDYLKKLVWRGFQEKVKSGKIKQPKEECISRLKEEFDVFEKTGVVDYFLFLHEVLSWADKNGIPRGPSRGSCSGSFALYCLGIITISALDYDLTFSRFLSEARAKPKFVSGVMYCDGKSYCDVDSDVSQKDRPKLLDFIEERFPNRTCKILTLQQLTGKMSLKETVKSYLEYDENQALNIAGNFESVFGKVDSIEDTLKKSEEFKKWAEENKATINLAKAIEGLTKGNGGVHASGTLVSYYPLNDVIPTELSEKGIVSGYTMDDSLSIMIKGDFLGLLVLDLLKECENLTGIKYNDIDANDSSIYSFLQNSDSFYGLFQISDGVTKEVIKKVKPKCFDHINSCLSIGRPGSIRFIGDFCKYLETGERKAVHPLFDEILVNTGNLIIFQEDINRICQKIYKISAVDSDKIRAAISKKKKEEMDKWEPVIREQGRLNNIPDEVTTWFISTCSASADYLFSRNHSMAYAMITAYTTYYKANYPKEYYLACLKMAQFEQDPIAAVRDIQNELQKTDLVILPPDILLSQEDFTAEKTGLRMGLSSVKGLSGAALEKIKSFRATVDSRFSLYLSLQNSKIPLNVITSLFLAGAFDSVKGEISRNALLMHYEIWNELTPRELPIINNLGPRFNFDLIEILKRASTDLKDEKGKPVIKESRLNTLRTKTKPYILKFKYNEKFSQLTTYLAENYYLGFSYSHTLKSIYSPHINNLLSLKELRAAPDRRDPYVTVVQIGEVERRVSKNKKDYVKYTLKDDSDSLTVMDFQVDQRGGTVYREDVIAVFHIAKKKTESGDFLYFVNDIVEQEVPTVLKTSVVRKELEEKQNKE